jgi:hypothetical protein
VVLPGFPIRYPRTVCAVAAVITLVGAVASTRIHFDFSTLKVRDPRVESVQALADLLDNPDLSVWTIDVLVDDTEQAAAVAERIEDLPGIEQVRTAPGFVPDDQAEKLEIFEKMRSDLVSPVELTDDERGEGLDRMVAIEYTIEGFGVALDIDADLRGEDAAVPPVLKSAERLREALGNADDERLRAELAVFAVKTDVAEELQRLGAHIAEVERVLAAGGAAGKRLDFLAQELNREANTLASKAATREIADCALELKLLIEQLREQVQNLE